MHLSALEIAQMQLDNVAHMPDTAVLMTRVNALDSYGQPIATWTDAATVPCGFEFSPYKFRAREMGLPGEETSEILVRARVSIDYYDVVSQSSRVRLTKRYDVALTTPETYEIQGFSERGPSGLILNLQRVEV